MKLIWGWRFMTDNPVILLKDWVIDDTQLCFVEPIFATLANLFISCSSQWRRTKLTYPKYRTEQNGLKDFINYYGQLSKLKVFICHLLCCYRRYRSKIVNTSVSKDMLQPSYTFKRCNHTNNSSIRLLVLGVSTRYMGRPLGKINLYFW